MRIKQMLLSSSSFPKAFQRLIYWFWISQNQPHFLSQKAIISFDYKGQKCVNANEVNPQCFALGGEKAIQKSLIFGLEIDLCF